MAQVQAVLESAAAPGTTTRALDRLAEETIRDCGGTPAFKGYHGFPASICASPNSEAVHGFPRDTPLVEGDILGVDVGVLLEGYYGDGAFTMGIGEISPERQRLLDTTRAALFDGIEQARVSNRLTNISHAIESRARSGGLSVVRDFGGHGVGRSLHEDPHVPNYGSPGKGPRLKAGYVLAIEPILSLGGPDLEIAEDGWTTTTTDGSPVAHYEHTVAITDEGPDILTLSDGVDSLSSETSIAAASPKAPV